MDDLDERRLALRRTLRAVESAARQLGHDPHPLQTTREPWHASSACRKCGADLAGGIDGDGREYGQGAATIRPCHIAASDTAQSPRPTQEVAA